MHQLYQIQEQILWLKELDLALKIFIDNLLLIQFQINKISFCISTIKYLSAFCDLILCASFVVS